MHPLVPIGFPSQRASNAGSISMSWRHHSCQKVPIPPSFHPMHTGKDQSSLFLWSIIFPHSIPCYPEHHLQPVWWLRATIMASWITASHAPSHVTPCINGWWLKNKAAKELWLLTFEELNNFFFFFSFLIFVFNRCNIFVSNWSNAMDIWTALWILMAWCFSTRASVATVLNMHSCVSSSL